jgi:threonine dehydratase
MSLVDEVLEAEPRIRSYVRETPLETTPFLADSARAPVHLKLECLQVSGSFKYRGAVNKLLSLTDEERQRGIVTASSGNHANAIAHALNLLGGRGTIFLPETVSKAKVDGLAPYDVELRFVGADSVAGEREASRLAEQEGRVYVSPYNDPKIVGGQGTIAIELERQLDLSGLSAVFVPVGGGGLIGGIASYLKSRRPEIRIIGCQPERSCVMYESVRKGKVLDLPSEPTLADGTAGGVDPETITFAVCRDLVDEFVLATEDEIMEAMRWMIDKHSMLIEGAAALSIAAFRKREKDYQDGDVVLVLSGRRVSRETLERVIHS